MEKRPHFKATITYLKTEDDAIVTPISSGFRTIIKFPNDRLEILTKRHL